MLYFGLDIVPELSSIILIKVFNRFLISHVRISFKIVAFILFDRIQLYFLGFLLILLLPHQIVDCIRPQFVNLVVKLKFLVLQSTILKYQSTVQRKIQSLSLYQLLLLSVFIVKPAYRRRQ